jgi:hypothetical protein
MSSAGILVSAPTDPVEVPFAAGLRLAVYDRSGRRVAGRGQHRASPLVRTASRTGRPADGTGPGRLVVAVPLQRDERLSGAVLGQRSDDDVNEDIHAAWLALAAVAGGIAFAAVLAAFVLGGAR